MYYVKRLVPVNSLYYIPACFMHIMTKPEYTALLDSVLSPMHLII